MKIEHTEISAKKVGRVWVASTNVIEPIKAETTMQGSTENIAREKLRLFLLGEPYSHLDGKTPRK